MTNYCNFQCQYCFLYENNLINTQSMDSDTLAIVSKYLKKYQVPLVSLAGGDPFLHGELLTFVNELINTNHNYCVIATNAMNMHLSFYKELYKIGLKYIQIGMDSTSNNYDENYKQKNHVNYIKRSIADIRKAGLSYGFAACITNENYKNITLLADYSMNLSADLLKISFYHGNNLRFKLTNEKKNELIETIRLYNKEKSRTYIKCAELKETKNYQSQFPELIIRTNGDMEAEKTYIGNIINNDPGVAYSRYIEERGVKNVLQTK